MEERKKYLERILECVSSYYGDRTMHGDRTFYFPANFFLMFVMFLSDHISALVLEHRANGRDPWNKSCPISCSLIKVLPLYKVRNSWAPVADTLSHLFY